MARIKSSIPTNKEIREGESEYRYISGTGLVLYTRYKNQLYSNNMHASPTPPIMDKKLEVSIRRHIGAYMSRGDGFIKADGTVQFTGHQSHGGQNIFGVNDLDVGGDIDVDGTANLDNTDVDGTLDVDGATTLDQVTVNTADGAFVVSGSNNIGLTTTGTADISLTSADKLEYRITGVSDWDTTTVDWDNSSTFDLTAVGNITIETSGAATEKKILIQNPNEYIASGGWAGIHIKTDSQGETNVYNGILIECDNVASKGVSYGVDIRSENNIIIRSEDANNDNATNILMRATGSIDIGADTDDVTPQVTNFRTKLHGVTEIVALYRVDGATIITDIGTNAGGSASGEHTEFQGINTQHLARAMTYKASNASLAAGAALTIVHGDNDDNLVGTVWKVTVFWVHSGYAVSRNLQIWYCFASYNLSSAMDTVLDFESLDNGTASAGTAGGTLAWGSGATGITWTNNHASAVAIVKASALKIQGASDF